MRFALAYALFAALATLVNIGTQDVAIRCYSGAYGVTLSVMAGTVAGLVVKYLLDKRYIFRFKTRDAVHNGQVFALYTLMGLATTAVFWAFEFGFDYLFHDKWLRYLGGGIGLAVGYVTKYQLDKRFVFRSWEAL
ncbi:MAG: GtrA family protein [Proteobacteria bacterium]|nr:GtrA family protein [Pseudomonadota bacterium]